MSKIYILDSDILIDFARGSDEAAEWIQTHRDKGDTLATTWINSCELLRGAYATDSQKEILAIRGLLSSLFILLPTTGTSELYAQIYSRLKKKGDMVNDFDILIASIAAESDATFVSNDNGFEKITELKLEKWRRLHIKNYLGILPKEDVEDAREALKKRKKEVSKDIEERREKTVKRMQELDSQKQKKSKNK